MSFIHSHLKFIFYLTFILKANFFKMASVRVRFSSKWFSGERFSAEEFAPANLFGASFPLEIAPAEFYFPLEVVCFGESCSSSVLQICREGNFPERKPSVICPNGVPRICRAPRGPM
jgi:hypothetical protein